MGRDKTAVKKSYWRDSRAMRGVEWLEADDGTRPARAESSKGAGASKAGAPDKSSRRRQAGTGRESGAGASALLRPPAPSRATAPSTPDSLRQLRDLFSQTIDDEVLVEVHRQFDGNLQFATDAILAMLSPPEDLGLADLALTDAQQQSLGVCKEDAARPRSDARRPAKGSRSRPDLWASLDEDCKVLIFDKLEDKALAMASAVSADMNRFAAMRWERRKVTRCKGRIGHVRSFLQTHANAECVDLTQMGPELQHVVHYEDLAAELLAATQNPRRRVPLHRLQLRKCASLDDEALLLLVDSLPSLTSIDVSFCSGIGDESLPGIAMHELGKQDAPPPPPPARPAQRPNARAARAAAVRPRVAGKEVTFTTSVKLSPAVRALLSSRAPDYDPSSSQTSSAPATTQSEAAASEAGTSREGSFASVPQSQRSTAAPRRLGVQALYLKETSVTETGLKTLFSTRSKCAHSLEVLDVSRCSGIKLDFLNSLPTPSALRSVQADVCRSLTDLTIELPPEATSLRELSLRRCAHLCRVTLTAPGLQSLAVSESKMLRLLALDTPALNELIANQCKSLHTLRCSTAMPALHGANLQGCNALPSSGLAALLASAPALKYLNISACREVHKVVVPAEVSLEYLEARGSMVRHIDVQTVTVKTLDARGSATLESVRIAVPADTLDLTSCEALESLTLAYARGISPSRRTCRVALKGCSALSADAVANAKDWAIVSM